VSEKRAEIEQLRSRLSIGLDKLLSTAAQVEVMQKELTELQPVLIVTAKEVESMMVTITADKASADTTKQQVAVQEADATAQVQLSQAFMTAVACVHDSCRVLASCIAHLQVSNGRK
jgi:dynein heavy chain